LNFPAPGTPRTPDGKANLSAKVPVGADGKPSLSGVWQVERSPLSELEGLFGVLNPGLGDDPRTFSKYYINLLSDFQMKDEPLRPEAAKIFQRNAQRQDHPTSRCLPMGLPGVDLIGFPFKILQASGEIAIFYEVDGSHRNIYTDGRGLPVDPSPAWLGYSVARWDGETLVVDTAGFNDKSWLDAFGHPHSEAMRVQERFNRRDFGHMDVQLTIQDDATFTRTLNIKFTELLIPDSDILEFFCNENEKDRVHMTGN
jgi:hypothetical protein